MFEKNQFPVLKYLVKWTHPCSKKVKCDHYIAEKPTSHFTPILRQLHLLPIQRWICHKILSATVYQSVTENTPLYHSDLLLQWICYNKYLWIIKVTFGGIVYFWKLLKGTTFCLVFLAFIIPPVMKLAWGTSYPGITVSICPHVWILYRR